MKLVCGGKGLFLLFLACALWAQSDVMSIYPPSRLFPPEQDTICFVVATSMPCSCRADTVDVDFYDMGMDMGYGYRHIFCFPAEQDVPYKIRVKCRSDEAMSEGEVNYRVLRPFEKKYPALVNFWPNWLTSAEMAKYQVVIGGTFYDSAVVHAREINPNLKVFKTLNLTHASFDKPLVRFFMEHIDDPSSPYYNCLVCDSSGNVLVFDYWNHPMFNFMNEACREKIVESIVKNWENALLVYDGIFFDRVQNDLSTKWWGKIDIDRDGHVDDFYRVDSIYLYGVRDVLSRIRNRFPSTLILINDGDWENFGEYVNGKCFELSLNSVELGIADFWYDFLREYLGWDTHHYGDYSMPFVTAQIDEEFKARYPNPAVTCPPESVEWVRTRYDRMRFGLTSALLGNGEFEYAFGSTWWGQTWWYEEYNLDIGEPVSMPYRVGPGWERITDFESGMGDFVLSRWNHGQRRTNSPDSAIFGYSVVAETDTSSPWHEFIYSNRDSIHFLPDSVYSVRFVYKILRKSRRGHFYYGIKTFNCAGDSMFHYPFGGRFNGEDGTVDTISLTFKVPEDTCSGFVFLIGIYYDGAIAVDNIVVKRENFVWRRDFENAIVLVNPSHSPKTIELEDTFWTFAGFEDPEVNTGQPITRITILPLDGRILLRHSIPLGIPADSEKEDFGGSVRVEGSFYDARIQVNTDSASEVYVYDITGKVVESFVLPHGKGTVELGGTQLPSGIYFVRVVGDQRYWTRKVLILR